MRDSARLRTFGADAVLLFVGSLALAFSTPAIAQAIVPEFLRTTGIDGFTFPESEAGLTAQIAITTHGASADDRAGAFRQLYRHGWGLWTALMRPSAQRYEGQVLRTYETWLSIDDLVTAAASPDAGPATVHAPVTRPQRLSPRRLVALRIDDARAEMASDDGSSEFDRIIGTIKFDPTAANHITQQQLLRASALETLRRAGAPQIPAFPAAAVIAKPVYRVISRRDLVAGRYYLLKVWSGPPATPQAWGPDEWTSGVWIDLRGTGSGSGEVDSVLAIDGSSRTSANTYPVTTFVHHSLSPADAIAFNRTVPSANAAPGDTVLLLAMHVVTRETTRWTWQTFWWTPAADKPPAPSSDEIAAAQPPQLQDAPRHYAMALAYTMLSPEQPYTGGANATPAVYAYNPWVEARFGPADLPDSRAGLSPDGQPAGNNCGVQTNCMSCHAQATYHDAAVATAPRFTGARYVDLIDPSFVGTLSTDFVWALSRHVQ